MSLFLFILWFGLSLCLPASLLLHLSLRAGFKKNPISSSNQSLFERSDIDSHAPLIHLLHPPASLAEIGAGRQFSQGWTTK